MSDKYLDLTGLSHFKDKMDNEISNELAGYQTKIDSNHKLDYSLLSNTPPIPDAQIQSDWNQSNTDAKDYIKNKPTIPAAQVNSDWNASSGVAQILNKPTIPTVPTISTDISTDASDDTKTASPKAVKTYADSVAGDANVIESISINGTTQTVTNKNVDLPVPVSVDIDTIVKVTQAAFDNLATKDSSTLYLITTS